MMLAGLEMPTSGAITYNGQPITRPAADRSLIFQQPSLYPWLSALDNVAFDMKAFQEQELAEMLDTRIK